MVEGCDSLGYTYVILRILPDPWASKFRANVTSHGRKAQYT